MTMTSDDLYYLIYWGMVFAAWCLGFRQGGQR